MNALTVPQIEEDTDVLTAALAYAAAGWFVLPVRRGSKNPGSVVSRFPGDPWQDKSSRDPETIVGWFAGTDLGIALHVGRSNAVVFDVDNPAALPPEMDCLKAGSVPFQSTREAVEGRGHYLYRQPAGRTIGNSPGTLGTAWGEVRGKNGVIIVEPSRHEKHVTGGRYRWITVGDVPVLPDHLAAALNDAGVKGEPDNEIVAALRDLPDNGAPAGAVAELLQGALTDLQAPGSRYEATNKNILKLYRLADKSREFGHTGVRQALETLSAAYLEAVSADRGEYAARAELQRSIDGAIAMVAADPIATLEDMLGVSYADQLNGVRAPSTPMTEEAQVDAYETSGTSPTVEAADPVVEKSGGGSSWGRLVELDVVTDFEPTLPTILTREDGQCLIYRGLTHSFHGETESCKSLVLQYAALQEIAKGNNVLYLDFESDARQIQERFRNFGVTPAQMRHLGYMELRDRFNPQDPEWLAVLDSREWSLVILDGVTEAMTLLPKVEGVDVADPNEKAALFHRLMPGAIAERTGAAVVQIDHVTKSTDGRGRMAIGGQHKMSALTGAAYTVEPVARETDADGERILVSLKVAKDRPGAVRKACGTFKKGERTQEAAQVVFRIAGGRVQTTVNTFDVAAADERKDEERVLVIANLLSNAPAGLNKNQIETAYREHRNGQPASRKPIAITKGGVGDIMAPLVAAGLVEILAGGRGGATTYKLSRNLPEVQAWVRAGGLLI